jgi:hypothetical protein
MIWDMGRAFYKDCRQVGIYGGLKHADLIIFGTDSLLMAAFR